ELDRTLSGFELSGEDIGRLLFPVCANCNIHALGYLLGKGDISNASELILHTLTFRKIKNDAEQRQVTVIDRLFEYVPEADIRETVNKAFVNAVWFGEYEAVKYLAEQKGADLSYESNGRSVFDLSENAVKRFDDSRVKEYLFERAGLN
ncbi:MAG: hypothetical protein ILP19_08895, partial [Oscillospiraceae bacterium]|nr:hypothetical protein [Oscillospiraceae bacterium]